MRATGFGNAMLACLVLALVYGGQVVVAAPPRPPVGGSSCSGGAAYNSGECQGNDGFNSVCGAGGIACKWDPPSDATADTASSSYPSGNVALCTATVQVSTSLNTDGVTSKVTWSVRTGATYTITLGIVKGGQNGFTYSYSSSGSAFPPFNNNGKRPALSHFTACIAPTTPPPPASPTTPPPPASPSGVETPDSISPSAESTSDPHFSGFDGTKYEFGSNDEAKNKTFALLTTPDHLLTTLLDSAPGPFMWPFWGTWMRGYGFRFSNALSMEVALLPLELPSINFTRDGTVISRSVLPAGGYASVLKLHVNGEDVSDVLESGASYQFGDANLHLPGTGSKHEGDASDGPVAVITTPMLRVVIYIETEEVVHLDLQLALLSAVDASSMHGVLGQTLRWQRLPADERVVQGVEGDYATAGLLSADYKYNTFHAKQPSVPRGTVRRSRMMMEKAVEPKVMLAVGGAVGVPRHHMAAV